METEVANPLRMLSAYFITAATTNPPRAYRTHTCTHKITHLYDSIHVHVYKYTLYRISVVNVNVHVDLHIAT